MQTLSPTMILIALLAAGGCGRGSATRLDPPADDRAAVAGRDTAAASTQTTTDTLPPCDGPCPTTASDVRGVYVLVEREGKPLPYTTHYSDPLTPGRTCTAIVESDTLTLRADGTFEQRGMGLNWCNDMPTPTRSTADSMRGTFGLYGPRGDSIAMGITELDPPAELRGVLSGRELRLSDQADTDRPRSAFRYVRRD